MKAETVMLCLQENGKVAMVRGWKVMFPKMVTLIPLPYDAPGTAVPHASLSLEFLTRV